MLYRRKVLLATLEACGDTLNATRLQKYAFEIAKKQDKPSYDFVPYRYGSYSFDLAADLSTMQKYGLVADQKSGRGHTWIKLSRDAYLEQLKEEDRTAIKTAKSQLHHLSHTELLRRMYTREPYFAINSEVAGDILNAEELRKVNGSKNNDSSPLLATIGYEGSTLDAYLNKLIRNNVKVLCDIRRNALSMKRGFSKSQLRHACEQLGIKYFHLPELGIASSKRQKLETKQDYEDLFKYYRDDLRNHKKNFLCFEEVARHNPRIAVTCFEADHTYCHRSSFVEIYNELHKNRNLPVIHL